MPALQWTRQAAHHRVGAASVDLKREKANLSNNRCTGIDATCTSAAQAGEVIRANLSSTKRRIAEDRLPRSRVLSISVTIFDTGTPSVRAIFFRLLQNASSRLTLVLCPSIMMERLTIADFMMCPLIFALDRNSNVIRFCSSSGNEKNADPGSNKIRRSYLRRGLRISKVAHVKAVLCDFHDRRLPRQRLQVPLRLLAGLLSQPLKHPINGGSSAFGFLTFIHVLDGPERTRLTFIFSVPRLCCRRSFALR
jgi:hypothetical protein